jgi:hypothetical protein
MAADHTFYLMCSYGALAVAIAIELWALQRRRRNAIVQARHPRQLD